jgi:hypothetical protein
MKVLNEIWLATGRTAGKGLVYAYVGDACLTVDVVATGTKLSLVFF